MELLPNGLTLNLAEGEFPLSTDSMVLSGFVKLPKNARVLDLGSGCGTLGLLLCASDGSCLVTGVELSERAHLSALDNIRRNNLDARMESICADLRQLPGCVNAGEFDVCVSNPPYFSGGPASRISPAARREDTCTPAELFRAAARALKYGGDFYLVHRPERLAELIARGAEEKLEAKRLCLIRHREGAPVSLIAVQFRKGAKPGLCWEEHALFDAQGDPTPYYQRIYHLPISYQEA